jgi:glucose/arabinose dehydrogenase
MKRMTLLVIALALAAPAVVCANEPASTTASTTASAPARSASPSRSTKPATPATAAPATQVAAAATGNRAHDRLTLDSTAITGNRELPKVMSIVPWKEAEAPQGPDRPMGSLIEEVLSPIDRAEFQREVTYYRDLTVPKSATQSSTPGAIKP